MTFSLGPWRAIREHVFVAALQPASVNIGLVVGDDHVLLVDTGSNPEQGRQIAASVLELVGRPVDRVVVTHSHWDHAFGLAGIDAEVSVAHESWWQWVQRPESLALCEQLRFESVELRDTTDRISLMKGFDLGGGVWVEVLHFGPAHTQTDLVVRVPGADVVFCGDLVEVGAEPGFDDSSSILDWPQVMDALMGAATDVTVYVPGHGEPVDRMEVFDQRTKLGVLTHEAEQMVKRGVKLDTALADLDAAEQSVAWPFEVETMRQVLPKLYAELAAKGVEPRTTLPLLRN